jgi:hypothetical protein
MGPGKKRVSCCVSHLHGLRRSSEPRSPIRRATDEWSASCNQTGHGRISKVLTGKVLRYSIHMRGRALRFVLAVLLLAQVNTLVAASLHRHEAELIPPRPIAHACIPGVHLSATVQPETYCPACEAIRHSVGLIIASVTAPAPTVVKSSLPGSRTHRINPVSHFAAGSRAPPLP